MNLADYAWALEPMFRTMDEPHHEPGMAEQWAKDDQRNVMNGLKHVFLGCFCGVFVMFFVMLESD